MRQTVLILIIALVLGLYAGSTSAQQKGESGDIKGGGVYNADTRYPGAYENDALLFRNSLKDTIWRSIPNFSRLYKVTCVDALTHLKTEGKWQGHLKPDGSCGSTAEPAIWVMGNRLNYEGAE